MNYSSVRFFFFLRNTSSVLNVQFKTAFIFKKIFDKTTQDADLHIHESICDMCCLSNRNVLVHIHICKYELIIKRR